MTTLMWFQNIQFRIRYGGFNGDIFVQSLYVCGTTPALSAQVTSSANREGTADAIEVYSCGPTHGDLCGSWEIQDPQKVVVYVKYCSAIYILIRGKLFKCQYSTASLPDINLYGAISPPSWKKTIIQNFGLYGSFQIYRQLPQVVQCIVKVLNWNIAPLFPLLTHH